MGRKRKPHTPEIPYNGDHGPTTRAATAGTIIEKLDGPNNMARRRRLDHLVGLGLSMRQRQAANAMRDAWCRVEMLSSGSPLKTKVDTSARPDEIVTEAVIAHSRWLHMTKKLSADRLHIINHVVCHNLPIATCVRPLQGRENLAELKVSLDLVANRLRY